MKEEVYLNLGCGNEYLTRKTGKTINVDINNDVKCDQVVDLENEVFPWADNSISGIVAKHIVEHIFKRDRFMNECWRVLIPGGKIYIETPRAGTNAYWKDPTHVSGWIEETFRYYCDWNTCPANRRETWEMGYVISKMCGDDDIIICELKKP